MDAPGVKYLSLFLGTTYLLPQIYNGYQSKRLSDISSLSMIMLFCGSMLWAYYMYSELEEVYFAYATAFVALNAMYILSMKYWYYVVYLRSRIKDAEESAV